MGKLKEFFGYVLALIVGLFGICVYVLSRRGEAIEELKTTVALAKTNKEADVLEAQVKDLRTNKNNLAKENEELDKVLKELDTRRVEMKEEATKLTNPQDIADYWANN